MWRKKRTISSMKPSSSFVAKTETTTTTISNNDHDSSDLDRSKHRCRSITNLLSLGTGVDDIDPASTRTINIDKDEEDEENYNNKDRWSHNNGKNIGRILDIIYDKSNNTFIDSDDDEDEDFEDSHIGNQIPTTMNNDDRNNSIDKLKGQLPISDVTPLTRPTSESFSSSSQTSSGKVTEKAKKETATDIMMKLPESFTYFHTKKEMEDKEKKVGTNTHSQHFPTNLHVLLDEAAEKGTHYSHNIVTWCSQGKAFQIHDQGAFVQSPLLAKHFGETNQAFDSFLLQLQAYDFHYCDKSGVVSHPLFIRGRRSLCFRMSQRKSATMNYTSLSSTTTTNQDSGGDDDDDNAAIDSNVDEDEKQYKDEEVYVVGYNDEEGSPYDYGGNNNNIGLDIDNDSDSISINSEDDEEEQIDSIEGQPQKETLLIVSDENNESKTLNVHNNNNSCQLRHRSEGKVSSTSAPDLTALRSSNPITSVSSSSPTTTKKNNAKGMITAHDKEGYLVAVSDGSVKHMKKNNKSSTSLSSIMKKENSTNSLTSLRSSSSLVRFGSVEIHEHSIELGCSVHSLRKGPAVTLGWERTSYEKMESIDDHKKQKEAPSPSKDNDNTLTSSAVLRPRSVEERIDKLLENGYTLREIRSSLREDSKERIKLKKLAAKRRFRKRTMSLPDFSTFFSTRK